MSTRQHVPVSTPAVTYGALAPVIEYVAPTHVIEYVTPAQRSPAPEMIHVTPAQQLDAVDTYVAPAPEKIHVSPAQQLPAAATDVSLAQQLPAAVTDVARAQQLPATFTKTAVTDGVNMSSTDVVNPQFTTRAVEHSVQQITGKFHHEVSVCVACGQQDSSGTCSCRNDR